MGREKEQWKRGGGLAGGEDLYHQSRGGQACAQVRWTKGTQSTRTGESSVIDAHASNYSTDSHHRSSCTSFVVVAVVVAVNNTANGHRLQSSTSAILFSPYIPSVRPL